MLLITQGMIIKTVIDVIVNLGKWNHAELAKVLHISHQRVRTLKKKESMVTGHGNCGKMEAGSLLRSRSSYIKISSRRV